MSKRTSTDEFIGEGQDSTKKPKTYQPNTIRSVLSSEDLDHKVLVLQNSNLSRRCDEYRNTETELNSKLKEITEKCHKQQDIIRILLSNVKTNNEEIRNLMSTFEIAQSQKDFDHAHLFIQKYLHTSDLNVNNEIKLIFNENYNNFNNLLNFIKSTKSENCRSSPNFSEIAKNREISYELNFLRDRYASCQEDINRLQNNVEDLNHELTKKSHRYDALLNEYNALLSENVTPKNVNVEPKIGEETRAELTSYKEISAARAEELKILTQKYQETLSELNRQKIPKIIESDPKKSPEYQALYNNLENISADYLLCKEKIEIYHEIFDIMSKQRVTYIENFKKSMREFRNSVKDSINKLSKELYTTKLELQKIKFKGRINEKIPNKINSETDSNSLYEDLKNENIRLKSNQIKNFKELNKDDKYQELVEMNKVIIDELENLAQLYDKATAKYQNLEQTIEENSAAHLQSFTENLKLTQQLKISNEVQESIKIENLVLNEKIQNLSKKVEELSSKVEEYKNGADASQKEIEQFQQLFEQLKKKINEINHKFIETRTINEKLKNQTETQQNVAIEWESRIENEQFKSRRLNEEIAILKRKLDKAHSNQYGGASDIILLEEVRMLKHKLTCHCCNTRTKDAILTKCFHLFCFECLTATYNSRQRKCPRCGQSFGSHDYYKIYF